MKRCLSALLAALLAVACNGPEPSRFGPTRVQPPAEPRPDGAPVAPATEPAERFGRPTDGASDAFLTQRIAAELEREIRERDARQAEIDRQMAAEETTTAPAPSYATQQGFYFPWSTVLGGTIGGVIGHQSGHRDEGILIGAGIGLLQDCLRWRW